ncbi:hypothetical protein [Roseibium album]|uniref:hypothetical protein n=1 Tax=Roseibium album TaxID=311410 RepID=UPI003BB1D3DC
MVFTWNEFDAGDIVLNPSADFRVNTVSRSIAADLAIPEDEIWWLIAANPAKRDKDSDGYYSLDEIWDLSKKLGLGDDPKKFLLIPPEYPEEVRGVSAPPVISLYARRNYINAVNDNAVKERGAETGIAWFEVGPAFRKDDIVMQEVPFNFDPGPPIKLPKGSTVVAVIDNGMAVGHELFRRFDAGETVSRVQFYWNMDGVQYDTSNLPPGTEPSTVGNAWTGKGLSDHLNANIHNGLLDDAAFYSSIGATDWSSRPHTPVAHRLSHGTHVMGLAAGYPANSAKSIDEAAKRPIIAVNLRTSDVEDPSGNLFALWLEQALFYILGRHKRFVIDDPPGEVPPLVINFSFGNYAGPHDGTGIVETKIRDVLLKAEEKCFRCECVLPAGNGNESRCHARIEIGGDTHRSKVLDWRVQPSDRSMSAVQIWLDTENKVASDYATLTVEGPGSIAPASVPTHHPVSWQELVNDTGERIGLVYFLGAGIGPFKRGHFGVSLYATDSPADVGPFAPSGSWKLKLEAPQGSGDVGAKAWIIRDETLPGFPVFGRQSYFDDPEYERFYQPGTDIFHLDRPLIGGPLGYDPNMTSAYVRRQGTLSGFASGDKPVVIGGFRSTAPEKDSPMALYSASGPTNNPNKTGPDASARSDDSMVLPGVLSAGSASGSYVAMPGTSVSAPQVTRWIACKLADGQPADPQAVHDAADGMDPATNPRKPPAIRSGGGRMLDLPILFGLSRWPDPPT